MITPGLVEKIGYYTVGDAVYYAKSDALTAAGGKKNQVQWHLNDKIYSLYDWTKEPESHLGIDEFYRRRAQQIRDKYDYLVLMYSGGPDSQNILETFVDNGIYIDEIVNVNSYASTGVEQGTIHNADYVHNVKPTLERLLAEKNLQSRITILDEIDLCKQHIDRYQRQGHQEILVEQGSIATFPYRPYVLKHLPHVWSKIISGIKVGMIVGSDKPRVIVKDGRWATNFYDALVGNYGLAASSDADLGATDAWEFFYWSPDAVELQIKQLQVLRKFMMSNTDSANYVTEQQLAFSSQSVDDNRAAHTCESKTSNLHLNYHQFHKLIYPRLKINFVTHKSSNGMLKPDMFWFEKIRQTDAKYLEYSLKDWMKKNPQYVSATEVQKGSWPIFQTQPIYLE